jgi:hypothetical protein
VVAPLDERGRPRPSGVAALVENELNQVAFELLIRYFNRKSSLLDALQNI